MLLLDVLPVQLSYLQFSLIIIAVIAAASGITYYLANLGSNAILDCNDMYQPDTNISLNLSDAQYMINSYKQNNIDTDTCAVWFSLKSIQNFACNIETNTKQYCNQNCSQFISPDGLGVRIYFAKYPGGGSNNKQMQYNTTDAQLQACINAYPGMTTLVMVPTYSLNGVNMDFDPTQAINGGAVDMASIYANGGSVSTVFMMNHGNHVPPPWPVAAQKAQNITVSPSYYTECGAFFLDN